MKEHVLYVVRLEGKKPGQSIGIFEVSKNLQRCPEVTSLVKGPGAVFIYGK